MLNLSHRAKSVTLPAVFLLSLLIACAYTDREYPIITPIPKDGVRIVENSGRICFESDTNAIYLPKGCYSSSCTRVVQQFGDVRVDEEAFTIHFNTKLVTIDPLENFWMRSHPCTTDCIDVGVMEFYLAAMASGTYSIWLGEKKIGELNVPLEISRDNPLCFTDVTPEPTAVYRPSATVAPNLTLVPPIQFISPVSTGVP
ncbi:MAG: hypothetical protein JW953_09825 [Anaerolineae bacterium]|nr:hypothetical protein [Anaerolineae bacterium]